MSKHHVVSFYQIEKILDHERLSRDVTRYASKHSFFDGRSLLNSSFFSIINKKCESQVTSQHQFEKKHVRSKSIYGKRVSSSPDICEMNRPGYGGGGPGGQNPEDKKNIIRCMVLLQNPQGQKRSDTI